MRSQIYNTLTPNQLTYLVLPSQANTLLQHICKAGNGHVPKPPKSDSPPPQTKKPKSKWTKCNPELSTVASPGDEVSSTSSEEKLARYGGKLIVTP